MSKSVVKRSLQSYLDLKYNVNIAYCDMGWKIKYKGKIHGEGDMAAGMAKFHMGMKQNKKFLYRNMAKLVENLSGLMAVELSSDAVLRELVAGMRIQARRGLKNVEE